MSEMMIAYQVVCDKPPCDCCNQGEMFAVLGPDGVCGSTSYSEVEDAEHEAAIQNAAYNAGYARAMEDTRKAERTHPAAS